MLVSSAAGANLQ